MSCILIADDDRLVLVTVAAGLREAGFDVIEACNGAQALGFCRSPAPPDLALLDIRMPGMDGLQLAQALRNETSVPFIFLTAYSDLDLVRRAADIGALGYLMKPLDVDAIIPALRTALARAGDFSSMRDALQSNRTIATAIGILMASKGLERTAATEHLRTQARRQRRKMEDIARNLIENHTRSEL